MAIKVITSAKDWSDFLRRAKHAFPAEHIEAIWGEETVDSYRITEFKRIRITKQTPHAIEYGDDEIKRQKWLAQRAGKVFLGTVHTHPLANYDTAPSAQDHIDGSKEGEKVMGVVVIYKKKNSTRFVIETDWWFPQAKILFEILPE